MIKKLILILALSFPIIGFSQEDVTVAIAYDWDQLSKSEQKSISKASQECLDKLADNDIKAFWESCHSKFKETTPFITFKEMGELVSKMIQDIEQVEFVDAKKVTYTKAPVVSKFSTGGSLDKEKATYLQFYTLAGIKDQALSIYRINSEPLSKAIVIKLGLEEGVYKLTSIEIATNSMNGKDADYYFNISNEWGAQGSKLPQFIAVNMAYRLSYLGRGTASALSIKVIDTVQSLQKNTELIAEVKIWNVNDSIFDIINIDFLETQTDITPNIIYISKVELGEGSTDEEVELLFEYFKETYPDLVKEFGRFMFTAYAEYPALSTKEYKFYRVLIDE